MNEQEEDDALRRVVERAVAERATREAEELPPYRSMQVMFELLRRWGRRLTVTGAGSGKKS